MVPGTALEGVVPRQGGVMRNIGRTLVGILVLVACVATAAGCAEAAKVSTEENSLLAPATVSVESGDKKNVVQWTAVPGAFTYNLYWDVKEPVTVADANRLDQVVSPFTHSGLQNGAHYYYVVTAVYPRGESPGSSQVSAAPRAPVLTAPESVTLLPGDRAITISWTPVAGATGYTVYWANSSGVRAGATGVSSILVEGANVHVHAGLASGLVYHYVVTASGPGGESSPSVEVSAATVTPAPTAPLNLSAVGGDGAIELAWSPAIGAVSYNVYGSTVAGLLPGPATLIASVESCNFRHTGLLNGQVHHYFVTGVGPGGEGLASAPVSATPAPDAPDVAPAAVVAVPGAQSVRLIWSPVAGATSYVVYWALMPGVIPGAAGVTAVTGLTGAAFNHVGLTTGDALHYVVVAVNAGGQGPPSAEVSAIPKPAAPGAPHLLEAVAGDGRVSLTWSASQGASWYNLYWATSAGVAPGGPGVTRVTGITTASHEHSSLDNGTTHFYVVTAVGEGGESAPSPEASATPEAAAPPAPLGVTAIVKREEAIPSVTLQWWDVPGVTGYNLYRGTEPGIAAYHLDPARATRIADVTAPHVDDDGIVAGTTYYYVVTALVGDAESVPSAEVSAQIRGSPMGKGGEMRPETGFGNNLSVPVVFADGYSAGGLPISGSWPGVGLRTPPPPFDFNTGLRPLVTESLTTFPFFDLGTAVKMNGVTWYLQGTPATWQAEWRTNPEGRENPGGHRLGRCALEQAVHRELDGPDRGRPSPGRDRHHRSARYHGGLHDADPVRLEGHRGEGHRRFDHGGSAPDRIHRQRAPPDREDPGSRAQRGRVRQGHPRGVRHLRGQWWPRGRFRWFRWVRWIGRVRRVRRVGRVGRQRRLRRRQQGRPAAQVRG